MENLHSNKKGVALLTVVLFFLVMVILLGGLLFATVNNLRNTQTAQKHTSVYYAAESGLNVYVSYIQDIANRAVLEKWDIAQFESHLSSLAGDHVESSFHNNLSNIVTANISITSPADKTLMPGYRFVSLTSTGEIAGVLRTVQTEFLYRLESGINSIINQTFPAAVIAKGEIASHSSVKKPIIGNIASNAGQIKLQLCPSGEVISPLGDGVYSSSGGYCDKETKPDFDQEIEFTDFDLEMNLGYSVFYPPVSSSASLLDLTGHKQFVISNWPSGADLTIKLDGLTDSDVTILKVNSQPDAINNRIKFVGKGRLVVFFDLVKNLSISNGVNESRNITVNEFDTSTMTDRVPTNEITISAKDSSKFSIIMKKVNENKYSLTIGNDFYGSVLTDANIGINWNNRQFYGYIVANTDGTVELKANSDIGSMYQPIYVYLPNADVKVNSGGAIWGTIVAETYYSNSAKPQVVYRGMNDEYPFTIWAPLPYAPTETSGEAGNTSISFMIAPYKEN